MDFIIGLANSEGKNVIMVVFDRLTMYAHFRALSHPFNTSTIATKFMDTTKKIHENVKIIVSDIYAIFTRKIGMNYFLVRVPNCLIVYLVIPNMMGKLRFEQIFGRLYFILCI